MAGVTRAIPKDRSARLRGREHAGARQVRTREAGAVEPAAVMHPEPGEHAISALFAGNFGGEPLAPEVRSEMEQRFDADLSGVRVHADRDAAAAAQEKGANAYTVGGDITFAAGLYNPRAPQGRQLLAHELAHVMQQSRGGPLAAGSVAAEQEANAASARVVGGAPAAVTGGAAPGVACDRKDPHTDFYWTAYFANRAWAQGSMGQKVEGFPIDPDLAELWERVDQKDEQNGGHDPAFMAFADRVKRYQAEVMAGQHRADGVVDPATAASLKSKPITRIGVTKVDARVPPGPEPEPAANEVKAPAYSVADDALGQYEDMAVDAAARAITSGSDLERRLVAAAMRGFIKEMLTQLVTQHKNDRARERMAELKNPAVALAFYASYVAGVAAGLVSPLTDLIGLGTLADALPALRRKLTDAAFNRSSELASELDAVIAKVAEVRAHVSSKVAAMMKELAKDPSSIFGMIESASAAAENMAGRMGHGAAAEVVSLFQEPWEDKKEKDPGWRSVLPGNVADAIADPSAALTATTARAYEYGSGKLKQKLFTTPWAKAGYAVGHVVGAVVANVALLLFTDGIGNAIAKIGEALAEIAPLLKSVGSALGQIGKAIGAVEHAIGMLIGLALKPLEPILKPLGELFNSLRSFLRKLLGVAEEEGALLANAAAKAVPALEDAGAAMPKPKLPVAEVPAPKTLPAPASVVSDDAASAAGKTVPKPAAAVLDQEAGMASKPKGKPAPPKAEAPAGGALEKKAAPEPKAKMAASKGRAPAGKPKASVPKTVGNKPPPKAATPTVVGDDPLVVAKIEGPNKGQYWKQGTRQFKNNAGTPTSPPNQKYVVLRESEATKIFKFREAGSTPNFDIQPRIVNGQQAESLGAGRRFAGPERVTARGRPQPGHPVMGRTTRQPPTPGAPTGTALESSVVDPAAERGFRNGIRAEVNQAAGQNALIGQGEKVILRPGNISTGGVDSITAQVTDGEAKVFLNDFTTPGVGKGPKESHQDWVKELKNAIAGDRLNFGDKKVEDAIRKAVDEGRVYVRTVRVESTPQGLSVRIGPPRELDLP